MVFYISVLRALATCLITNSHYGNVYPSFMSIVANGGLLGDVIFFSVSGYCLCNIKAPFFKWYTKRLYRIYIPVWIITLLYLGIGAYSLSQHSLVEMLIYPTRYHFIRAIILLYIPFFMIMRTPRLHNNLSKIMGVIGVVYVVIYLFFYDKTFYHIDSVYEPMIHFLFFESMLLGAWIRKNESKEKKTHGFSYLIGMLICLVMYFFTKIIFARNVNFSEFQVVNQGVLFALLFCMFKTFGIMAGRLENMPYRIKQIIRFLSKITLEIYVVQYVLIDSFCDMFEFPVNLIVITAMIIAAAWLLNKVSQGVYCFVDFSCNKLKERKGK